MKLTFRKLQDLERDGFLVLPGLFSREEVDILRSRQERLLAEAHEANIVEKSSGKVRTAMGLHLRDEVFARLVRHPRLVEPTCQVRSPALYIQQVKINVKAAFTGEAWQWHYDFATHHADDGVPEPLALNLHVFLDTVTPFNGPLYFIPGSHAFPAHDAWHDTESTSYPLWVVENRVVEKLVTHAASINPDRPIVQATGAPGTGLIFFDTVVHGSPGNMSPWDRSIFSLILNPVDNALTRFDRPDFKHHRDLRIVEPLEGDCLVS